MRCGRGQQCWPSPVSGSRVSRSHAVVCVFEAAASTLHFVPLTSLITFPARVALTSDPTRTRPRRNSFVLAAGGGRQNL